MNLEELIRVLENQLKKDREKGMDYSSKGASIYAISIKMCYMRNFIDFLKKEKYNNFEESINKYHEQYLENKKKNIENDFDETKIKEKVKKCKENKSILPNYENELDNLEKILKAIQKNDEKVIEEEKNKKFLIEEKKSKRLKEELLEFLLSEEERKKLLQEKESTEIENEDLRKATDLILNCIKKSKEEILKEIKEIKKD